jgi:hypothetical protein
MREEVRLWEGEVRSEDIFAGACSAFLHKVGICRRLVKVKGFPYHLTLQVNAEAEWS